MNRKIQESQNIYVEHKDCEENNETKEYDDEIILKKKEAHDMQESLNIYVEHKDCQESNETKEYCDGITLKKKEVQEYVTPFLPDDLCESFDILYSPLSANELFTDTLKACDEMKATVLKQKRDKVKALFTTRSAMGNFMYNIEIVFRVYVKNVSDITLSVLHMQRHMGDLFEYHKIYKAFLKRHGRPSIIDDEVEPCMKKAKHSIDQNTEQLNRQI